MFLLAGAGVQSGQGRKKPLQEQEAVDHLNDAQKAQGEEFPLSSQPRTQSCERDCLSFHFD